MFRTLRLTALLIAVLAFAQPIPLHGQAKPAKADKDTSRSEAAARKVAALRRRIEDVQRRQRELLSTIQEGEVVLKQADASLPEYEKSAEQAKTAQREAEAAVKQADQARVAARSALDEAKSAAEASREKALVAHRSTPQFQQLAGDLEKAEAAVTAAEAACVQRLMQQPEFAALEARLRTALETLEQRRAGGDRAAIATASQAWMDAQNKHNAAREAGLAADPAVKTARDQRDAAQAAVGASLAAATDAWAAGDGRAMATALAEQEAAAVEAAKRREAADQARVAAARQADKAASDLAQRRKARQGIELKIRNLQREGQQSEARLQDLQQELRIAQAELAASRR